MGLSATERSALADQVARRRLELLRPWVATAVCPVHKVTVPLKADGSLGGYCHKCLGECASALERWGYRWRLHGYVRTSDEDRYGDGTA